MVVVEKCVFPCLAARLWLKSSKLTVGSSGKVCLDTYGIPRTDIRHTSCIPILKADLAPPISNAPSQPWQPSPVPGRSVASCVSPFHPLYPTLGPPSPVSRRLPLGAHPLSAGRQNAACRVAVTALSPAAAQRPCCACFPAPPDPRPIPARFCALLAPLQNTATRKNRTASSSGQDRPKGLLSRSETGQGQNRGQHEGSMSLVFRKSVQRCNGDPSTCMARPGELKMRDQEFEVEGSGGIRSLVVVQRWGP